MKQGSPWENFGRRIDWNFASQPLVSLGIIYTFMKAKTTYSSWWKKKIWWLSKRIHENLSLTMWRQSCGHVWDDPSTPVCFREILGLIIHAFILWSSCPSMAHICVLQIAIYALLQLLLGYYFYKCMECARGKTVKPISHCKYKNQVCAATD